MSATIEVAIGRFGERVKKIKVPSNSTIGNALKTAGITLASGEKVWINGERSKPNKKVEKGDIFNIVGAREGGC